MVSSRVGNRSASTLGNPTAARKFGTEIIFTYVFLLVRFSAIDSEQTL